MKRNIRKPSGFNEQELEGYFMISNQDAAVAILNKLTGLQMRLWLYLMMIDPFADCTSDGEKIYKPIPSPQSIAIKLGANPDVILRDMRVLKKLELYDYRVVRWQGHNHTAKKARAESSKMKTRKSKKKMAQALELNSFSQELNNSSQGLNSPYDELNSFPEKLNSPAKFLDRKPCKASSLSQTNQTIQTNQTFSNKKKEIDLITKKEQEDEIKKKNFLIEQERRNYEFKNENYKLQETDCNNYENKKSLGGHDGLTYDSNSRDCSKNVGKKSVGAILSPIPQTPYPKPCPEGGLSNVQKNSWRWLPDGPWVVDGKLDGNFHEWLAQKWKVKYGHDIFEARANVLACFRNDSAKLPIKWQHYQEEYVAKAKNIQVRLNHGCQISDEQKQKAISNRNAIKPLLPEQELIANDYVQYGIAIAKSSNQDVQQLPAKADEIRVVNRQLVSSNDEKVSNNDEKVSNNGAILVNQVEETLFEAEVIEDFWAKTDLNDSDDCDSDNFEVGKLSLPDGKRYRNFTGVASSFEVSPEQQKKVKALINDFLNGFKGKKTQSEEKTVKELPDLNLLNEYLSCSILRKDSSVQIMVQQYLSGGYQADYDESGYPVFVYGC